MGFKEKEILNELLGKFVVMLTKNFPDCVEADMTENDFLIMLDETCAKDPETRDKIYQVFIQVLKDDEDISFLNIKKLLDNVYDDGGLIESAAEFYKSVRNAKELTQEQIDVVYEIATNFIVMILSNTEMEEAA